MKKRIMVVDSDPAASRRIQTILAITRHSVSFAFDATTAITEARRLEPHLVFVDLSLHAGGGLIVVERLRDMAEFAATPVIVTAERGARLEAERVFQAGANAFLPKPFDPYMLLDYVGRFLPADDSSGTWLDVAHLVSGSHA